MRRFELVLVAFFLATWVVDFLALIGLVSLAGSLELGLYPLYSVAAASGWLGGNIYVPRARSLPKSLKRRFFLVYFVGPLGLFYLLRTMAPVQVQEYGPFVPLYGLGVFTVFFAVPMVLKSPSPDRLRNGKLGRGDDDPPVVS
ncbi:MAG: hypothetical protein VYE73_00435 [Acidobacteriota bacterium]|nr:hypothetical protein [Acidobacteriota bacterium]